jgi:cyclopropane fatty-acyl-phospholipid synthase-like methyltransferase
MSTVYDEKFYEKQKDDSAIAAEAIIPYIIDIFQPESVLDIGCGVGTWLRVFKEKNNVKSILGVDGDYVDRKFLQIGKEEFVSYNLEKVFSAPKRFDLAMSVEVGEHIAEQYADNLVKSLTNASDFVVFSAAIPGQTGTYHINEQYPEYWAKKFAANGYICVDYVRKKIWNKKEIVIWYKQNILLFIKKEAYESRFKEKLEAAKVTTDPEFLTRIHPETMLYYKDKFDQTRGLIGFLRYHLYPLKKLVQGGKK